MKLICLLLIILLFASCGTDTSKFTAKTDSGLVLYRAKNGGNWAAVRAMYTISRRLVTKDSSSTKGVWITDTPTVKFWIENHLDTLRDAQHKPLRDSLSHQVRFNFAWYKLSPDELSAIQFIVLPK